MAEEKKQMGCFAMIAWFVGAILALMFVVSIFSDADNEGAKSTVCSASDAPFYAEQAVEAVLKNPDEADFSPWSTWEVKPVDDQYEVTGQVTATNSFNANIKSTFKAIVRCDGGTWYLGRVTME